LPIRRKRTLSSRQAERTPPVTERGTDHHDQNLTARAKSVFDKVVTANGRRLPRRHLRGKNLRPNAVHPLGGCVRGRATDAFGRVHGYDGLYVNDASLIPGYLECNPFMSITALAERNVEGILQDRR
jgi:cholesterol oxidase